MSIKIICDEKIITEEFFFNELIVDEYGKRWVITDLNNDLMDIKFKIKECSVKYMPEKYDKITVEINKDSLNFFNKLRIKINDETGINVENITKFNTTGFKISQEMKEKIKKELKIGEYFDAIVGFNSIWKVNGKFYVSLELEEMRKVKKPEVKEKITNYFTDEE